MLLPHELKKGDFSKSFKGYTTTEVDDYIDFLIEKYTEVHRENDELERKLKAAVARIDDLLKREEQLKDTLLSARNAGDKIIDEANERADLIVRSAMDRCNSVLAEFGTRVKKSQETISDITEEIEAFKTSLYVKYNGHIEQIEQLTDFSEYTKPLSHYNSRIVDGIKLDLEESLFKEFEAARRLDKKKAAALAKEAAEAKTEISTPAAVLTPASMTIPVAEEIADTMEISIPAADEETIETAQDEYVTDAVTADTAITDIPAIIDETGDYDSCGGTPDGDFIPDESDAIYIDQPEEAAATVSEEEVIISEEDERAFAESAKASLFAKKSVEKSPEKPREDPLSLTDEFELVYSNNGIVDGSEDNETSETK